MRAPGNGVEVRVLARRAARRVKRALRAATPQPAGRPWRPGLPGDLPQEVLAGVVRARTGQPPGAARHQHLSGWKASGAYRVVVDTAAGPDRLIFKDARYGDTGTLDGLDLHPGPAEFAVYGQDQGCLQCWLPEVCWREEALEGHHYRYLLEDLAPGHAPVTGPAAVLALCSRLPGLHGCLDETFATPGGSWLLRYDGRFARDLPPYATAALARYAQHRSGRRVRAVLRRWGEVEATYRQAQDAVLGAIAPVTVHGDLNLANVFAAQDGSGRLRLLDWEWAGTAIGHFDLAAVLKRADPAVERQAVERYAAAAGEHPLDLHWRAYLWCKLQRGLFDAGFLARRATDASGPSEIDLHRHVELAAGRALAAWRALAGLPGGA